LTPAGAWLCLERAKDLAAGRRFGEAVASDRPLAFAAADAFVQRRLRGGGETRASAGFAEETP
jgi:hypothetical protein